ncbi:MAG: hypothetical protein JWL65_6165 [Gammaproteobacteria bacterium]|nr:hypothetical protein [Gammaproteobacteria bacterium]
MASKLRFSLAACLIPVVLSIVSTVQAADTPAADAAQAPQPSCATTLLEPNDQEGGDGFGYSVAVHGQTALVGIPLFSTAFVTPPVPPPYVSGRVAVFNCDASTQTWTRTGTIQLAATEANQPIGLGFAVALQGDLAAIGAQYGLYIYKRQGQNWNQVVKLLPKDNSNEQWGAVLAFKDNVLALGVTVPSLTSTIPNTYYVDVYQILILGDHGTAIRIARLKPSAGDTGAFGASLALNADTLVVGDPPDTTAYVYRRRGFTFTLEQKLTGAEATTASEFGSAVAISKDVILIGAPGENAIYNNFEVVSEGAAYAFRHESGPDSPWVETQHFTPATLGYVSYASFGGTVAVNGKGQAVIGTPGAYDFETQTEYGPTFLYTLQGGQFALTSLLSSEQPPATSMGITNEYVITGYLDEGLNSGAEIWDLDTLPTN